MIEGIIFPTMAKKLKVRKQVTGAKYFAVKKKSGSIIYTSI